MKRILSVLLVMLLGLSLTACGSGAKSSGEGSKSTVNNPLQNGKTPDSGQINESEGTKSNLKTESILIVYFSRWGNTDYPDNVDATTSASIVIDKDTRYGTTEYIANMITKETGGDLHRIETVTPYTEDFDELCDVNHDEMNRNFLPKLKESNIDISAYDTVFIGYPVWATDVPQAVLSFLNEYNLSGKTVIPFCTHDGYGAEGSYKTIMKESHAATSLEGIAIEAKDVPDAQTDNTNLSVDVILIGRVTSEFLVFDSLDSREDITFSLIQ